MKPNLPTRRIATAALFAATALLCAGCTGFGSSGHPTADSLASLQPGHDQIIAWVPREQAQTANVAQAVAHIALIRAKQATDAELCRGAWVFSGKQHLDKVPQLSLAPASLGGFSGWQVRIVWQPQLDECGVAAQTYALTLSRHLPRWMLAQSGQPLALFHQGTALYHQDNAPLYALASSTAYN